MKLVRLKVTFAVLNRFNITITQEIGPYRVFGKCTVLSLILLQYSIVILFFNFCICAFISRFIFIATCTFNIYAVIACARL